MTSPGPKPERRDDDEIAECKHHGRTAHRVYVVNGWRARRCLECKRERARAASKQSYVPVSELTPAQRRARRRKWREAQKK